MESLFGHSSEFAAVGKIMWIAQLALIVHVLKTGRPYWWFFILLSAPVIGGVAYLLIEIAPDFRVTRVRGEGGSWKPRAWRIRDLRAELEETDTVKLRLQLADELFDSGQIDAARQTAEECLQGVFRDDPHTLAAVARYRIEADQGAESLLAIDRINTRADRMLAQEVALLRGRALLLTGKYGEAQQALKAVAETYIGEEPRYFLALALQKAGALAEARDLWTDIRKRFRRASPSWRRSEKRWFNFSGDRLKETKG